MKIHKLLNIIFTFVIILLIIYIFHTNMKKDTISINSNNPTTDSNTTNNAYDRIDTILKNSNFNYEYDWVKFPFIYFSIAEYNESNFSLTEYKANDGDSINLNLKTNDSFLVTLAGGNVKWTLNNADSLKNVSLEHISNIVDWKNVKPEGYMGLVYGRDNFYFSTKSKGPETLQFKYPDGFTVNINITIS